ncbi:MAG TPA: ABC transporter substrate-binding protein [Pseudonocardiaceae bacterium]|nr:ABC transporter substrate-binding protein [Pseudonocardiaceae bacterium]
MTSRCAVLATVLVLGGAAALTGCGGSGGAGDADTITVGVPPVVELGDLYVAESRGFFTARGLKVTVHCINVGAALVPALQSGALEVGQSNVVSVLQAAQQHLDVKCFAGAYRSPGGAELSLVVSPHSADVTTPAGLAGRTIAVNTLSNSNQLVAEAYLAAHGVAANSVRFVAVAYPNMPDALSSGRVAAAITDEPFTTMVRAQGAKVLVAQPDSVIAPHPVYPCWVATGGWLSGHRTQAAAFVAALQQADAYMADHPDYLPSILPKYTSVSAALAKSVVLPDFATALAPADIQPWSAAAARFHVTSGRVDPSAILDIVRPSR